MKPITARTSATSIVSLSENSFRTLSTVLSNVYSTVLIKLLLFGQKTMAKESMLDLPVLAVKPRDTWKAESV